MIDIRRTSALAPVWLLTAALCLWSCTRDTSPRVRQAKWSRALNMIGGPPAVGPDGVIYAPGSDQLLALNRDGSTKWSLAIKPLAFPVIRADGTIFVVTSDYSDLSVGICAIDPSGIVSWRRILSDRISHCPGIAIGSDSAVYCAVDSSLLAVGPDSVIQWRLPLGQDLVFPPVVGIDRTVYACSYNTVSAVAATGVLKWSATTTGTLEGAPVVGPGGRVFCVDQELFVLDTLGAEVWRHAGSTPVIGADSVVHFLGGLGHDTLWELHPGGSLTGFPTSVLAEQCALTNEGRFYCCIGSSGDGLSFPVAAGIDAFGADGSALWTFRSDGDNWTPWPPVVGPDGTVYLATASRLYAVADSGCTDRCWWPMYQHDARHSGRAGAPQ